MSDGAPVSVMLPGSVPRPLDYLPPKDGRLAPGDYVRVPLAKRQAVGVVWGKARGDVPHSRLRRALARMPLPPMPREMRQFIERAADYTVTPLASMLSLAVRESWLAPPPPPRLAFATGETPGRLTPQRKRVMEVLEQTGDGVATAAEIARAAGVTDSVVRKLVEAGAIRLEAARREPTMQPPPKASGVQLSDMQREAAAELVAAVEARRYQGFVLQGVTGSGKTEVYMEAAAACVAAGRQALVLLPEIALTESLLARFASRMGFEAAAWHSGMSHSARGRVWRSVARGESPIVIGARSALFLPFRDLGLVVVDEEHDSSFKQEEGVIYSARDMAVLRASGAAAPAVLASATVSLESWVNASRGRYRKLSLPERIGSARLPSIATVDLRVTPPERGCWLAPPLVEAIRDTLDDRRQTLLFLNRRGFAPLTLCRSCGYWLHCPNCDTHLVAHAGGRRLLCHQCEHEVENDGICPECGKPDTLAACGPGVERVAEEVKARFPEARRIILSSDTVRSGAKLRDQLGAIERGEVDIVVGTQLVAKGHHFPGIALVGVVDADLCMRSGDLRAGERTFQILRQVAGRAGREGGDSRALLQTADPGNVVFQAIVSGDEEKFLSELAEGRRLAGAPPYTRYAAAIVSAKDSDKARRVADGLARAAGILHDAGIRLYGPARPPFMKLRGRWRWRFLATAPRSRTMQPSLRAWRESVRVPSDVRVAIDVDPLSFL